MCQVYIMSRLIFAYPSKHEELTECCFDIGPPPTALAQHWNIWSTPRVFWDEGLLEILHQNIFKINLDARVINKGSQHPMGGQLVIPQSGIQM